VNELTIEIESGKKPVQGGASNPFKVLSHRRGELRQAPVENDREI